MLILDREHPAARVRDPLLDGVAAGAEHRQATGVILVGWALGDLEVREAARSQDPEELRHVLLLMVGRHVLKHQQRVDDAEPVVLEDPQVPVDRHEHAVRRGAVPCLVDHLAGQVDAPHLAVVLGERPGQAAEAAPEVERLPVLRHADLLVLPEPQRRRDEVAAGGVELVGRVRPVGEDVIDRAAPGRLVPTVARRVETKDGHERACPQASARQARAAQPAAASPSLRRPRRPAP